MSSILITGFAGFVGSHLCERLLSETSETLVVLDDFNSYYEPALKRGNAATIRISPRVDVIEGDIGDQDLLERLFKSRNIRYVFHLAASPGVPYSLRQPAETVENNVLKTTILLEEARKHSLDRFIFASSSTVYGRGAAAPFVEDAPLGIPASPYGASKRAGELLGLTYHQLHQLPFVGIRFFNVYGPRLRPELALAVFARKILLGEPLPLYGDGSVLRDFTHVSDICTGLVTALSANNIVGECINLGNDRPISMLRLIQLIEEGAGKKARVEYLPPRGEDLPFTHASLDKARKLLGYAPKVPIEQGVKEYIEWLRPRLSNA